MCNATEIPATRSLNAQLFFVCHATYKVFYKKIPPTEITTGTFHTRGIHAIFMTISLTFIITHMKSRLRFKFPTPYTWGSNIPTPWKTLIIKFPPPRDGKCVMPGRKGGDVEASIWPIHKYEEIITPLADYESRCLRKRNYQVIQKRNTIFEWIVKGLYLIKINRQNISYLIGHYRLIDWVFDDRSRSICYVMKYVIPLLIRRNWMMYLLPSHQQYTIFCRLDWFLSFWATSTALQSKSIPCVVRVL